MKIVDTFMLNGELDLLEFRLEYLYDHVDHFVIVESNVTHRGVPKTLFYALYNDRFEKYKDKIIHIITTDIPKKADMSKVLSDPLCDGDHYVYREQLQRSKIIDGLRELELDYEDIVLVSNIDEVPSIQSFKKLPQFLSISPLRYKHKWLVWNHTMKRRQKWYGTCAFQYTHLIQNPNEINSMRLVDIDEFPNEYFTLESGWHFNWFGGVDSCMTKIYTTSLSDRNQEFYFRKKSFRDLALDKRYPSVNTSHIEKLESVSLNELPESIDKLPYFEPEKEPLVYDTFIYNGEKDALLIRLFELYDTVDYFLILEGNHDSNFEIPELDNELSDYEDKIIYVQLEDYTNVTSSLLSHELKMLQKSIEFLNLKDNDFIYYSQIECIPSYETLEVNYFDFERFELEFVTLQMRWFYESFETEINDNYYGTILTNWNNLKNSSLYEFFKLRDEPVHSIIQYRGWYLCNFFKHQYDLFETDTIVPTNQWDYFPKLQETLRLD